MSYTFQFLLRAQEEYESSIKWYLSKSDSAAENFIAVDNALFLICLNPHMWRNTYKVFYELGLKKFPFSIVYTIDDTRKMVVVTSLFHQRRNNEGKYSV